MKRIIAFTLLLFSLLTVACGREPKREIVSITIENSFNDQTIYVNDVVDLSAYDFIITYSNGETEIIDYSVIRVTNFSTLEAGNFEFTIIYKNKDYKVDYVVTEPTVTNCRYVGEAITMYKGENMDLSAYTFLALYSNGEEKSINLNLATMATADNSLTKTARDITFSYEGKNFTVPCTFTYRPIEENKEYTFVDTLDLYYHENIKITISETTATLYTSDRSETLNPIPLTAIDFNRYIALAIKGGDFVDVEFHLINDTIYLELYQE